ncbi:MAG: hypothetical protein LBS74_03195 [Oscillospiraceae bacterium]|jgi:hypothetical protein|nr:hypothetical protein [Oscillospiraceae bacterium]
MQTVERIDHGFITRYVGHTFINESISYYDKGISFILKNGETNFFSYPQIEPYQSQFGVSVSNNGEYIFIQDWDKGLFCYKINTAKLQWHSKQKRVTSLIVGENFVLGFVSSNWLIKHDIETGELIQKERCTAESFFQLDDNSFFVGPIRRRWKILETNAFEVLQEFKDSEINSNRLYPFIVANAYYEDDCLVIEGFEQSNEDSMLRKDMLPYKRKIPLQSAQNGDAIQPQG